MHQFNGSFMSAIKNGVAYVSYNFILNELSVENFY